MIIMFNVSFLDVSIFSIFFLIIIIITIFEIDNFCSQKKEKILILDHYHHQNCSPHSNKSWFFGCLFGKKNLNKFLIKKKWPIYVEFAHFFLFCFIVAHLYFKQHKKNIAEFLVDSFIVFVFYRTNDP